MDNIKLKGIRNGIKVVISNAAKYDEIESEIEEKIESSMDLFKIREEMVVIFEGGQLTHMDKCTLQHKLYGMVGKNVLVSFEDANQEKEKVVDTIYHKGTLRAGQNIYAEGHLIILGDVNPGAEVAAGGNVVVLGALKGLVQAGANGDRKAHVIALSLAPTQIRIADIITRAPDDHKIITTEAEMAYVKDDRIYIDGVLRKI